MAREFALPAPLLTGASAQCVDLEVVPVEPADQSLAPPASLARGVRVPTLGKQSNAHECTPVSP
ncbi:hypothetical protein GCM10010219_23460 [Streptomyces netropsis]|nr:hypothetical protein GCM10010219_23460 [Streptomyces netropsis]